MRRAFKTRGDFIYDQLLNLFAFTGILMIASIITIFTLESIQSIKEFGLKFLYSVEWDPFRGEFGGLVFIYGSFIVSMIALAMAVPLSIGVALFISEYCPESIKGFSSAFIELLAGIPSVVYGLWGLTMLVPLMREHVQPALAKHLGFIPIFKGGNTGVGILTTSMVLAIMILPIISLITYEVMSLTPNEIREAAYALGATKGEVSLLVLRGAYRSLVAGIILGLGRAFGETMVTTMLIGGSYAWPEGLFSPAYTIASLIVHEFRYAYAEPLYRSALIELALMTLAISVITSIVGRRIALKVTEGR